jgi:hypothetical protein
MDTLNLQKEIDSSRAAGMEWISIPELDARLETLGYRRDPDSRCVCVTKNLTTGNTYPCVTWDVQEIDTGMSAFHVNARRDERFRKLQELRFNTFAVLGGKYISL